VNEKLAGLGAMAPVRPHFTHKLNGPLHFAFVNRRDDRPPVRFGPAPIKRRHKPYRSSALHRINQQIRLTQGNILPLPLLKGPLLIVPPRLLVYYYMKFFTALVLAGFTVAAQAPRAQGHGYFGLDNPSNGNFDFNSAGVGADIFVYQGAAFSPAVGWTYNRSSIGRGAATVQLNGSYHFLRGKGRFEPFITGGYGALTNFGDSVSLFNYGGGGQYWFNKHLGARVEVINFQHSQYRELTSIRFGISFR